MSRNTRYVKRTNQNTKITLLGCTLITISIYLATNAFLASKYVDNDKTGNLTANFYLSTAGLLDARLAATINRESKGLEFMVWRHERRELSLELSKLLQQRINATPLNGNLWSQLSYVQKDAGAELSDRAWVIERTSRMLGWNFYERSKISHYCITEYDRLNEIGPDLCSSLISNLPSAWPDSFVARHANVDINDLRSVKAKHQSRGSQ